MLKRNVGLGLPLTENSQCCRSDDSGCGNALFCLSISFSLSKGFICVGVGTYI